MSANAMFYRYPSSTTYKFIYARRKRLRLWKILVLVEVLVPDLNLSNVECPFGKFHISCLSLREVPTLKTWYCPHCCRLPQFKQSKKSTEGKQASAVTHAAMLGSIICICKTQATAADRLLECHSIVLFMSI